MHVAAEGISTITKDKEGKSSVKTSSIIKLDKVMEG